MNIDRVHVIFKTHLDVGFTDFAHRVVQRYLNEFIPQAIQLAQTLAHEVPDAPFRWTLGSWLVYEFLERASADQRRLMEDAISAGYLKWHALPFTTHTEFMDADLFRAGLTYSQELDRRFGMETIAAKMTDVPGHTRAMVPLLAEAGVRFLHIGLNPAATVPDVPPVFIWCDEDSASEIICMYQRVYGDTMVLPGTNAAVSLVFTGDNLGPPSRESALATFESLRGQFSGAAMVGATLDDIGHILDPVRDMLPVVTAEIGDTWIHGVGSDPTLARNYRALLRLRTEEQFAPETRRAFERQLLLVPEHTWGLDVKTHLQDYENYDPVDFARARPTPPFQRMEASWQEQRDYLDSAVETLLGTPQHAQALAALDAVQPQRPDLTPFNPTPAIAFETAHWRFTLDPETGAFSSLRSQDGQLTLATPSRPFARLHYETFSNVDYDRFWQQYIRDRESSDVRVWAHPDNVKPGMQVTDHGDWSAAVESVYSRQTAEGFSLLVQARFPVASRQIGAPQMVFIGYEFRADGQIAVKVQWFDKPACRLPEAFWLSFNPPVAQPELWRIRKLGRWISPLDVVSGGGRTMHATDAGARYQDDTLMLDLATPDSALVAPGERSLLNFHNRLPDMTQGLHFNLFNNVWGTNFRMWFGDDALFRFVVSARKT